MTPSPLTPAAATLPGLDALIRRELKVGDPNDPVQLAQALMARYQSDRRAQAIDGEARGLPFLHTPIVRPADAPAPVALDIDLEQARDRVRVGLQSLLTDSLSTTLRPELEGWQGAITAVIDEGVAAARQGLDPGRRDIAFGARRQLGEYARLARLVGVFSPALNAQYRGLATSLDDVAAVLLVMMGDAMANLGLNGGRFLLATPYPELQARRDAVLAALRRIDGLGSLGGSDGWPRGLRAHRQLNLLLEARGQGELRSLLHEPELARTMDDMVQLASGGTPHGLRSIGSTTWSPLARMRRFVRTVGGMVDPAAHELAGLVEALRLFIEGFEPAGGFRLMRVARPALLSQSGGGLADEQPADRRLMALTRLRPVLADQVDAWMDCVCERRFLQVQAALDRLLFELDRAIDAYATGSAELGLCEGRAAALHLLIGTLLNISETVGPATVGTWGTGSPPAWVMALRNPSTADPSLRPTHAQSLRDTLQAVSALVRPPAQGGDWRLSSRHDFDDCWARNAQIPGDGAPAPRLAQLLHDEIVDGRDAETQTLAVVQQMALDGSAVGDVLEAGGSLTVWHDAAAALIAAVAGSAAVTVGNRPDTPVPAHFELSLQRLANRHGAD